MSCSGRSCSALRPRRSWRGLTAAPDFLLAHHRSQPSLPLFEFYTNRGQPLLGFHYYRRQQPLPLFVLAGPERVQPLLGLDDHDHDYNGGFALHASCDGLLLISNQSYKYGRVFSMCNPATRQHAPVPGLNAADCTNIEALYLHRPSGEYRVLYWKEWTYQRSNKGDSSVCYILMVPRVRKPRCIGVPAAYLLMAGTAINYSHLHRPPVMFCGSLHWDPSRCSIAGAVVVFDTVAESFRSMRLPAAAATSCRTRLHDMEGLIGLSCFDDSSTVAKLWVLEDYEREVWSLKYKIDFSPESMCNLAKTSRHLVLCHEGDMLLYSNNYISYMVHYEGKFLEEFKWGSLGSTLTGHLFKERFVKHAFFPKPCSAPTVRHSCLFRSL